MKYGKLSVYDIQKQKFEEVFGNYCKNFPGYDSFCDLTVLPTTAFGHMSSDPDILLNYTMIEIQVCPWVDSTFHERAKKEPFLAWSFDDSGIQFSGFFMNEAGKLMEVIFPAISQVPLLLNMWETVNQDVLPLGLLCLAKDMHWYTVKTSKKYQGGSPKTST